MDKKELILEFIQNKDYVPMKAKQMKAILMVPKDDENEFFDILNELEKEVLIMKDSKNRYIFVGDKFVKGIYRVTGKNYGFVEMEEGEDIFIPPNCNNNCFNGDSVLVEIVRKGPERTKS